MPTKSSPENKYVCIRMSLKICTVSRLEAQKWLKHSTWTEKVVLNTQKKNINVPFHSD